MGTATAVPNPPSAVPPPVQGKHRHRVPRIPIALISSSKTALRLLRVQDIRVACVIYSQPRLRMVDAQAFLMQFGKFIA